MSTTKNAYGIERELEGTTSFQIQYSDKYPSQISFNKPGAVFFYYDSQISNLKEPFALKPNHFDYQSSLHQLL